MRYRDEYGGEPEYLDAAGMDSAGGSDRFEGEYDFDAASAEAEELELAAELLEIADEAELDRFLGRLIRRAGRAAGRSVRSDAGRALGGLLKRTARKALPIVGRAVGGRLGGRIAPSAGRIFGLELEGLSPEDQEFETARRIVRLADTAAANLASLPQTTPPQRAAQAALAAAATRHAPGLVRAANGACGCGRAGCPHCGAPPRSARHHPAAATGHPQRWGQGGPTQHDEGESAMHDIDRTTAEFESELDEYEFDEYEAGDYEYEYEDEGEFYGEADLESPFEEYEEMELAAELLSVGSEEELDQFLGKLFKKAWKGIRKAAPVIGRIARPLGGVLKGLAKKALPAVGGALGSFIPIPGVGTAVGTALGSAAAQALEFEFEGMAPEDQEFETARRVVRIAGAAAKKAAQTPPAQNPQQAAKAAVVAAAKRHVPALANAAAAAPGGMASAPGRARGGRWIRRGRRIVLLGV